MRDHGYLDFGRGFMGFDVVRSLVGDLRDAGLCFGTLSLRWRGEPLLHPEVAPILRYLLAEAIGPDGVAERVRIETDGRFLTDELLDVAAMGGPQDWVFDLDRGDGAGVEALWRRRGEGVSLVLVCTAGAGSPARSWIDRYPQLPVVIGARPVHGDALWVREQVTDHYLAAQAARAAIEAVAEELGQSAPTPTEARAGVRGPSTDPVVSWDGKVALCPSDVQVVDPLGEITPGSFSTLWAEAEQVQGVSVCGTRGRSDRGTCGECGRPYAR